MKPSHGEALQSEKMGLGWWQVGELYEHADSDEEKPICTSLLPGASGGEPAVVDGSRPQEVRRRQASLTVNKTSL